MPDKFLFKTVAITSMITGAFLGIIPLFPALIWIAVLALMFFIAPFIVIYFKRLGIIEKIETDNTVLISAISGFFAVIGFCIIYMPLGFLLNLIFKIQAYTGIKVLFLNIGYLIPMVFLTALLGALFNAFSGFVTVYFYNTFSKKD